MISPWVAERRRRGLTRRATIFGHQAGRYHVKELEVRVSGPDRKGRYEVAITSRFGGGSLFHVEEQDWPAIEPVIDAARAASATST